MSHKEAEVNRGHVMAEAKLNNACLLSAGAESQTRQVLGMASEHSSLLDPSLFGLAVSFGSTLPKGEPNFGVT